MNLKEQNRRMLNVLRYLDKFNLGDYFEGRVRQTLIDIGKCPHQFTSRSGTSGNRSPGKCIFCDKTRTQIRNSK